MMKTHLRNCLSLIAIALFFASCGKEKSAVTGWNYNDPKNGGFEVVPYDEQETGPGLVLIEGGTFTMGRTEQEITMDWNNIPRRVTVSSFYIDETEVANVHYLEYLYWLNRVYSVLIILKFIKKHCLILSYGAIVLHTMNHWLNFIFVTLHISNIL